MSDYNQLLNDITNAELNKQELERQLKILNNEYKLETTELQRLNSKNLEYSAALQQQETAKKLQDESQQKQQAKENLDAFINELSGALRG